MNLLVPGAGEGVRKANISASDSRRGLADWAGLARFVFMRRPSSLAPAQASWTIVGPSIVSVCQTAHRWGRLLTSHRRPHDLRLTRSPARSTSARFFACSDGTSHSDYLAVAQRSSTRASRREESIWKLETIRHDAASSSAAAQSFGCRSATTNTNTDLVGAWRTHERGNRR
jgi:hypothetical protein